jgi:Sulfotransferase domain
MTVSVEPSAAVRTSRRRVPDFFIVGHPKCGTTALYEMLRHHTQVYMPDVKEPDFFSTQWPTSDGPPGTLDAYLSLFDAAEPQQHIGEASVSYLTSHTAANGIAAMQPAAQIIAILREPASFLRSLHLQFVESNVETEKDFRKALSLEDDRRQDRQVPRSASPWQQRLVYSDHVRYVEQLRRYHALFPPEQVLVLIYDDFRRDNETSARSVLRFLDVDDTVPIDIMELNPTVRVRSRYLNRIIYGKQGPVWRAAKEAVKVLAPGLRQSLRSVNYSDPPPPDEKLMVELRHRFKPEVVALSEYLDRDLVTLWGYDSIG